MEKESIFRPVVLQDEVGALEKESGEKCVLDPSRRLIAEWNKDMYFCRYFDFNNNLCKVYAARPLDCRLYPFMITRSADKAALAVDLNCPYASKHADDPEFKDYAGYLLSFLRANKGILGTLAGEYSGSLKVICDV